MYSKFQLAQRYINYYLTAKNGRGHGIHSPFIFQFINRVLNDKFSYDDYEKIESLRRKILNNDASIVLQDFGAGSSVKRAPSRRISSIARVSVKSKKYAQLLYRVVRYFQPSRVLELGTSLGITTSYLALANPQAKIITLEGDAAMARIARQHFQSLDIRNIEMPEGNFDETLTPALHRLGAVDFCFIDGNHRRDPTERYFSELEKRKTDQAVFVFDDIHWSREMEDAWDTIRKHPSVSCSVDLFFIGIIFFQNIFREKQHFIIRF